MDYSKENIKNLLPKRPQNSHKGTFGHVLNIAGSGFYTGAAFFSSVAPLKVGCGKVTLASTEMVLKAVSALTPDVILKPLAQTKENSISQKAVSEIEKNLQNYEAVSIGCGLSTNKDTFKFFEKMINIFDKSQKPVVIDADGLTLLGKAFKNPFCNPNMILTPHPKEMSGLVGASVESILSKPEFWAGKCSEKYNCTTVLKIHKTVITDNQGLIYINSTGNSALAHGGSGDVLCGMITGLLAQGLGCFEACVLGVYLHGITAEIASQELSEYSVLASDLLKYIPSAIKTIL